MSNSLESPSRILAGSSLPSSWPVASSSNLELQHLQLKRRRTENLVPCRESSCALESLTAVNPYDCFSAEEVLLRLLEKVTSCLWPLEQDAVHLSVESVISGTYERAVRLRGSSLGL